MEYFIADLENQLQRSEKDLMLANEKIAIYDDKIRDKNDIMKALKLANSLLKSKNKEKFDAQVVVIRKLQQELYQKDNDKVINQKPSIIKRTDELSKNAIIERLQRNSDNLENKLKSYQDKEEDNKQLMATLKALIKEKDDQISLLEMGQNLDKIKIKKRDDLLKDQAENFKHLGI